MIGQTISHYRVIEKIGEGGMGEVYRAHDTKLNRDVALKILPQIFAHDSQRMARFEREAQVLASLNHSHIAQIHGLEETGGTKALVLELVEGETLQEQISRGPIPVDEALKIALQITEGLEAAHEKGIINRDLKPANIKITPEGEVKILDFGLAKALEGESPVSDLSHSPTITHAATEAGVILGTASYMSPEQARGKPVDKRTDIWAFGCVLFEMLTGKKAFDGDTITDVLAAILQNEPKWDLLLGETPPSIRRLLRRSLQKDLGSRIRDIGDAQIEIADTKGDERFEDGLDPQPRICRSGTVAVIALAGVLFGVILTAAAVWLAHPFDERDPGTVLRATLQLPVEAPLWTDDEGGGIALSPDGSSLVYSARIGEAKEPRLGKIQLDNSKFEEIQGSGGAGFPFFSPDGNSIGYSSEDGLKAVSLQSQQQPSTVFPTDWPMGAAWGADGWITFPQREYWGLSRIPASGGEPEPITSYSGLAAWPQLLPDGETVLFSSESALCILRPSSGSLKKLPIGGMFYGIGSPRYVKTGHLVYGMRGRLMAVPFSIQQLEVTGAPVQVLDDLRTESLYAGALYDFSEKGTLAYVRGGLNSMGDLAWVYKDGSVEPLPFPAQYYTSFRLSPDGQKVAVTLPGNRLEIFVYDLESGTSEPFVGEGNNLSPVWSPDASKIAFASDRDGSWGIYTKPLDTDRIANRLHSSHVFVEPMAWSPSGKWLAFAEHNASTMSDIGLLSLEGKPAPRIVVNTDTADWTPTFSPDGRFLAYWSSGIGVYVQSVPEGEKQLITNLFGETLWSHDGSRIYLRRSNQLFEIAVDLEPDLKFGKPEPILDLPGFIDTQNLSFDESAEGNRFLIVRRNPSNKSVTQIEVIVNWFEELKRLVPTE